VIPVITPEEMGAIDAAAPESVEVLVARAGAHVSRAAVRLMGGCYGRRVVVVVGKGNNGADGRDAARRLSRLGCRVEVIEATDAPATLPAADLVIDAAYGTGFHGSYDAPDPRGAPVLAVDIPSGVDGLTGAVHGRVAPAVATVTFAALKPGLVLSPGREMAGEVRVADIGLDVASARAGVVTASDVTAVWPRRAPEAHKWHGALSVVAGSPGMTGAAHLVAAAAQRSGVGMVQVSTLSAEVEAATPIEAVGHHLSGESWADGVLDRLGRFGALVVGPGLGRNDSTIVEVARLIDEATVPMLIDADGLFAIGADRRGLDRLADRPAPTVLTPHTGEFERLFGGTFGADRTEAARHLAERSGSVVLLKGPVTVVADPGGRVRYINSGDQRLATAGTGDVLAGIIGAAIAGGADAFDAAAAGAWLHGAAAGRRQPIGLVATDVIEELPSLLSDVLLSDVLLSDVLVSDVGGWR